MTLRNRILLLIALLLGVMLALGGWGSRWLAAELSRELDQLALGVGRSLLDVIDDQDFVARENPADTVVLVERIIEDEDGNVTRASHQQVGQQITRVAIQVGNQPTQLLQLPELHSLPRAAQIEALRVEAISQAFSRETASGSLLVTSGSLNRQIPIPKEGVADALERHAGRLTAGLIGLFLFGVLGALLIAQRVAQPLKELRNAARDVGQGERGVQVDGAGGISELQDTISAFNQMSLDLEELAAARARLADRDHLSELGEIGRGLAHSLRNPLNTIGLAIDRLAAGQIDEAESSRLAADARSQINRIDARIRSFLTLASASQAITTPVDLRGVIRDVALELLQGEASVEIDLSGVKAGSLPGVNSELRAMIQALMVNAVEASRPGQTVRVTLQIQDPGVQLTVTDQGPGIAPDIAQRLFLPHVTSKADGSGMGLYLTRRLAESHYAGSVQVTTGSPAGTIATLTLKPRQLATRESSHD